MKTMKRQHTLSQNFIRRPNLVRELIRFTNLKSTDTVYDFGAGSGVISSVLAETVEKVVAIEFEPRTVELLRINMEKYDNVEVIKGDAIKIPLPSSPYKIFANIPFHLSSPIIHRFINSPNAPQAAYLITQKQFGKKLVATDTTHFTGQLGMIIGAEYEVKILRPLKRTDFWPHPAVDTVFIGFVKRKESLVEPKRLKAYQTFTEECFSDPKKLAKMPLEVINALPGISPSRLHLNQWIELFKHQTVY
jgi:16S rRNA A1518/A1519 N6-dimethyltransferase RsmA/KsgA/DIM1 with predicted DNA glycosylase/AP lyase activity